MGERLSGKVAIVTGGAAGIGRATCELFAHEGARRVVADVDVLAGVEAAAAIVAQGGQAAFVRADIAHEADARRLTEETVARFGGVDVLVNNAAVFVLKGLDATVDDWPRSLGVNVIGTALVTRVRAAATMETPRRLDRAASPWRPSKASRAECAAGRRDSGRCASASRARGIDVQNLHVGN